MAASSSSRPSSPISNRTNPNPNPKSIPNSRNPQERDFAVRKSLNGGQFTKAPSISLPRSFNPTTPANSPADYARRCSFGKESGVSMRAHEQKENDRDPNFKNAKLRSPSVSKSAKNFMAPTISAASKINASPRKKVLGERNEAVRASASLSDGKFYFFSMNSLDIVPNNELMEEETSHDVSSKAEATSCITSTKLNNEGNNESESDSVVLSPDLSLNPKNSSKSDLFTETSPDVASHSLVPTMAPLDADPALPPYDPKSNYLSPRPQYLHYKPRPRIEAYLNQGIRFEDNLDSESFSESESNTEEATQFEDLSKECDSPSSSEIPEEKLESSQTPYSEEATHFEDSSKECDSSSSSEILEEKLEYPQTPQPKACHPKEDTARSDGGLKPKPGFFTGWKLFVLLLVLALASLSVIHSPVISNALHQNQTFLKMYHEPGVVAEFGRKSFYGLCQNVKLWSLYSVNHLLVVIRNIREVDKFSPPQFRNLTIMLEEIHNAFQRIKMEPFGAKDANDKEIQPIESDSAEETQLMEPDDLRENTLDKSSYPLPHIDNPSEQDLYFSKSVFLFENLDTNVMQSGSLIWHGEARQAQEKNFDIFLGVPDEPKNAVETEDQSVVVSEGPKLNSPEIMETVEKQVDIFSDVLDEPTNAVETKDESVVLSQDPELNPLGIMETVERQVDIFSSVPDEPAIAIETEDESVILSQGAEFNTSYIIETVGTEGKSESSVQKYWDKSSIPACASLAALLAATFLILFKLRKPSSGNAAAVSGKYISKSIASSYMELSLHESPHSHVDLVEVDMEDESCPSEMSSFQRGSSSKKVLRAADSAQSHETKARRNHKRESLASSSEYTFGSPSYGSFTTYSIVPSKHGDEEVVTPVRRSSRIRSQVTSS